MPNETGIVKDRLKTLTIASEGNTKNFDVDANPIVTLSSLSNLFPKATSPEKKPSGGGKKPGSPQKQPTTVKLLLPAGQSVTDGWGTYTGIDENNFSYVSQSGKRGTYNNTKSGWKTSAEKINAMWAEKNKGQSATPSAVTTPATTPAAGTPAAEAPTAGGVRQLNQVTVACVRAVLQKASEKALAFWTGENERGRIRDLASSIQRYGGVYSSDALSTLAQMVVAKNEQYLNSVFPQDVSGQIYQASKADLKISGKGRFSGAVAAVLSVMNQIFNEYVENKEGYITAFVSNQQTLRGAASSAAAPAQAPATPPATPAATPQAATVTPPAPAASAAPAATATPPASAPASAASNPADDGMTKKKRSQSIDPRIKKLAILRRLRVRSQMEAAVEASSMFGRSRVS
jgi:hypothetical protein